jgi:hypothetical protein
VGARDIQERIGFTIVEMKTEILFFGALIAMGMDSY